MSIHSDLPYDLSQLSPWCVTLLWCVVLAEVLIFFASAMVYWDSESILQGVGPAPIIGGDAPIYASDIILLIVWVVALVVYGAALTVNAIWIYWASANARALAPHKPNRVSPRMAVLWHFVPVANVVMPFTAFRQIWHDSLAQDHDANLPLWIWVWWFCWVVSGLMVSLSLRVLDPNALPAVMESVLIDVVNAPVSIVAAALFIRLIQSITDNQGRVPRQEVRV